MIETAATDVRPSQKNTSKQKPLEKPTFYVLDTNVLIHDPVSILNFEEHHLVLPITVLEELDSLKTGKSPVAADARQAIREIDKVLGRATPQEVEKGVPIRRGDKARPLGCLSILMPMDHHNSKITLLPDHINDNKILNEIFNLKQQYPQSH